MDDLGGKPTIFWTHPFGAIFLHFHPCVELGCFLGSFDLQEERHAFQHSMVESIETALKGIEVQWRHGSEIGKMERGVSLNGGTPKTPQNDPF